MNPSTPLSNPAAGIRPFSRRHFLSSAGVAAGGVLLPSIARSAVSRASDSAVTAKGAEPWAPHARAAPQTARRGDAFTIDANGTRTCTGGWQWRYEGIVAGQGYELSVDVAHEDTAVPRDMLNCVAIWGQVRPTQPNPGVKWDYLLPAAIDDQRVRFSRKLVAPAGATQLVVRATLRWTANGRTVWNVPSVASSDGAVLSRKPVRISVVTGTNAERLNRTFKSVQENVEFYGEHCQAACERDHPALILLPETALQWGVRGHAIDLAVPASGRESDAFAAIARRHGVRIGVGMYERDGDAVFNSLLLLGASGAIEGCYRKVHLAQGEDLSGVLPGDTFPVLRSELGRIGCNICMDSMAVESARVVALKGADFLLLPIMGDFRADRWDMGPPLFHEARWRTIMRAQALDNQFAVVVARNRSTGSCIVTRQGEFLAWNDGSLPFVSADVPREDAFRSWNGADFRDSTWMVRRPHLYDSFCNSANYGGST